MNDALLVGLVDSLAQRGKNLDDLGAGACLGSARCVQHVFSQALPLYILGDKADHRGELAGGISGWDDRQVVDTGDVGMMQCCHLFRLLAKLEHFLRVGLKRGVEDFDDGVISGLGIAAYP